MRWLTLPIGADQAGKPVSTLLRRELGLSAAGVRRAKALLGGILLDGAPSLPTRWPGRARSLQWMWGMLPAVSRLPPFPAR